MADYKVRIVTSFPDLKVRKVNTDSKVCGEWRFVSYHEDFTIQFVDHHEDFSISYTDYFPGLPDGKSRLKPDKTSCLSTKGNDTFPSRTTKLNFH